MREILFRGKRIDNGEFVEGDLQHNEVGDTWISKLTSQLNGAGGYFHNVDFKSIVQYTGVRDKHGERIFEGDRLLVRMPERSIQTHTGDNIPLGSYTEPMEPMIVEIEGTVRFVGGSFNFIKDDEEEFEGIPLLWERITYDLESAKDGFAGGWCTYEDTFNWESDLEYILSEYGLSSEDDILNYLGIEIKNKL